MNYPGHIVIPITLDELYALARGLGPGKIKRKGDWVLTCCPVPGHGKGRHDENPSLWLGIAPSGKTLAVSCKAGCDRNVVAAELKLRLEQQRGNADSQAAATALEESAWEPLDYAPAGTKIREVILREHGGIRNPQYTWVYRSVEKRISHVVYRWEKDGEKTFQYAVWCQHKKTKKVEWHLDWYPRVYDLLYSELLADYPDLPVLVVEGEKTCDAARKLFGDRYFVTTWALGATHAHLPDWSILKGRKVVVWPDNDEPGRKAMHIIAACLVKAGVEDIKMVVP